MQIESQSQFSEWVGVGWVRVGVLGGGGGRIISPILSGTEFAQR